jgi:hypothetical protein
VRKDFSYQIHVVNHSKTIAVPQDNGAVQGMAATVSSPNA